MGNSTRRGWFGALALMLVLVAGAAMAQTPQTIVIDGVNDFLSVNQADLDTMDVQFDGIDLKRLYLTNDAVNLYAGIETGASLFGSCQIGIAIDLGTADGGSVDPWGRAIEWTLAANKPDYMFYVNLDNNWQASYEWDGSGWVGLAAGPAALGMATGTEFKEVAIMLGMLGVSAGTPINFEAWLTQDSPTKGPLDAFANDASQLSTPGFTLWDTASPIPLMDYHSYTVQAAADPDPPVVLNVEPSSFPVDSFFDVFFNEPVKASTVTTGNFNLAGAVLIDVWPDPEDASIVHIETDGALAPSGDLYILDVTGVEDLAGNVITENGEDDRACFGLKEVTFRGRMGQLLGSTAVEPPYSFSIEGSKAPLTFDPVCDTGIMTDMGEDVWEYTTIMLYEGDCAAGTASESFEWKMNFMCGTWEGIAGNRVHTLDLANGASDIIDVWWNDEDPTQFTTHDIDVEFFVDMSLSAYAAGDTVGLNGDVLPLTYDTPSLIELVDDGTGNDAVAGDMIFSTLVTFPAGSRNDVEYKFLLNGEYECSGQSNRYVFLNSEMYDTVGGTLGPLTLPVVTYDYCNAIHSAVEVVFAVDFNNTAWESIGAGDVVTINGTPNDDEAPTFDWTVPSLTVLADDGVAPDAVAGDKIYTVSVMFPAGNVQNIEYKFLVNDIYECLNQGNRTLGLDPDNFDAVGNPQIAPVAAYQRCNLSDVPGSGLALLQLSQNHPNPFNPSTTISFSVPKAGQGELAVFNLRGQKVRTLLSGDFAAGPGSVVWNGRSDDGHQVSSGVYFYRLNVAGDSQVKRMVMLK